jgi:uncharacterized protein
VARWRIGLISDTHSLLRPQAVQFLRGCDRIIHGGDIGHAGILAELARLAPVTAVRGNNDSDAWAQSLPLMQCIELGDVAIQVIHDLSELPADAVSGAVRAVVFGHSHQPALNSRAGVLYINPGSAGPRRFKLPVSVAELIVAGPRIKARLVSLDIAPARRGRLKAPAAPAGTP